MRAASVVGILLLTLPVAASPTLAHSAIRAAPDHVQWVMEALKHMQMVRPGMTRADLLQVFEAEGGWSTGLARKYVYRGCRYFKVDVQFEAVGRQARDPEGRVTLVESAGDVIKTISPPRLEWSVVD